MACLNPRRAELELADELLGALEAGDGTAARNILEVMLAYSEEAILGEAARLEAQGVIGPGAAG